MLEILVEFGPGTATRYGLAVRRSPDGAEETLLEYDAVSQCLQANRQRSSLDPAAEKGIAGGFLDLGGEQLRLLVYLDHSMIEVYANGLKSLTTRVYPTRADALGLRVWANGTLMVRSLEVWRLRSAYD
jgi:sucrose-6-phosphate hydrolase SacC (GH32 family)